jgi:hypothetical protein
LEVDSLEVPGEEESAEDEKRVVFGLHLEEEENQLATTEEQAEETSEVLSKSINDGHNTILYSMPLLDEVDTTDLEMRAVPSGQTDLQEKMVDLANVDEKSITTDIEENYIEIYAGSSDMDILDSHPQDAVTDVRGEQVHPCELEDNVSAESHNTPVKMETETSHQFECHSPRYSPQCRDDADGATALNREQAAEEEEEHFCYDSPQFECQEEDNYNCEEAEEYFDEFEEKWMEHLHRTGVNGKAEEARTVRYADEEMEVEENGQPKTSSGREKMGRGIGQFGRGRGESSKRSRSYRRSRRGRGGDWKPSDSPVKEDVCSLYNKIPSYVTDLSIPTDTGRKQLTADDVVGTVHDSLPADHSPPRVANDDMYNKMPSYASCFTNSTKYDKKHCEDSNGADPVPVLPSPPRHMSLSPPPRSGRKLRSSSTTSSRSRSSSHSSSSRSSSASSDSDSSFISTSRSVIKHILFLCFKMDECCD